VPALVPKPVHSLSGHAKHDTIQRQLRAPRPHLLPGDALPDLRGVQNVHIARVQPSGQQCAVHTEGSPVWWLPWVMVLRG
jgi:hypothetical protein